jgi:hypothetical protein
MSGGRCCGATAGRRQDRRDAPGPADRARGRRLLLRLDRVRNCPLFSLGVALAAIEMQQPALARAVPIAVGVVVLIAGSLRFTAWNATSPCLLPGSTGRGRTLLLGNEGPCALQFDETPPCAQWWEYEEAAMTDTTARGAGRVSRTNCFDPGSLRPSRSLSNPHAFGRPPTH